MSLKNRMERELGTPVRLRIGAPGSLIVLVDGRQIYSKKQSGHAPDAAEIVKTIREKTP